MDFDFDVGEINMFALVMGIIAALITIIMFKYAGFGTGNLQIGLFWKILTPIVTFIVAYLYIDKTS
jgi:hypothetical protein